MTPPTLLTEWARLLLGGLRRAGVRQVVLSPGSRSTPFTWAALHEPGLDCRTIIDERSAAFFALGHARVTGRPVLLVCTSGSAAANYFPAVAEAAESSVPVLVLTADRPLELQGAAAPQTIDQVKLYGDYARAYFELGTPDPDPRMLRAIPRIAAQAMAGSMGPIPGPVHLNARARKPLEPRTGAGPAEGELHALVDRLLESVPTAISPAPRPDPADLEAVARSCRNARRGLIVCGPAHGPAAASPDAILRLARATGFPVAAEAASQIRFAPLPDIVRLDHAASLLDVPGFADRHEPDVILQVGRPPTASAWHAALDRWTHAPRHVLAPHGWPDPFGTATTLVRAPLDAAVRALADAVEGLDPGSPSDEPPGGRRKALETWRETLRQADDQAGETIAASLEDGFPEGRAVRTVVDRLADGAILAVGNSLPIREVDTFVDAARLRARAAATDDRTLEVLFQRGANGIDGLVSGAAGAAAASGRPTTLLIGDVSLAHDIGALGLLRDLPAPLTVVVLNNGGGRIFERLPIAESLAGEDTPDGRRSLDAWLTPPALDFSAAARTFGIPYEQAGDDALSAALDTLSGTGGLLEIVIPENGTTVHQRELRRRIAAALAP